MADGHLKARLRSPGQFVTSFTCQNGGALFFPFVRSYLSLRFTFFYVFLSTVCELETNSPVHIYRTRNSIIKKLMSKEYLLIIYTPKLADTHSEKGAM